MTLSKLQSELNRLRISLRLADGEIMVAAPGGVVPTDIGQELLARQDELARLLADDTFPVAPWSHFEAFAQHWLVPDAAKRMPLAELLRRASLHAAEEGIDPPSEPAVAAACATMGFNVVDGEVLGVCGHQPGDAWSDEV